MRDRSGLLGKGAVLTYGGSLALQACQPFVGARKVRKLFAESCCQFGQGIGFSAMLAREFVNIRNAFFQLCLQCRIGIQVAKVLA